MRKKNKQCTGLELLYCIYRVTPKEDGTLRSQREAFREAGYGSRGNDRVDDKNAYNVEKRPHVKEKIEELRRKIEATVAVNAAEVINETIKIAFFDIGKMFDEKGNLLDVHKMPVEARRVISGIDVFEEFDGTGKNRKLVGYTKKIRMSNKIQALEQLHKYFGNFEKDNKQLAENIKPAVCTVVIPEKMVKEHGTKKFRLQFDE